jgi:glycosyltransferase involved in cell wall biosynthesis
VHAHFAHHPTVAALALGALAGIPFSFTCHAHDVYLQRAMLGEKVHRAAFVVAISRLLRDQYIARCAQQKDLERVYVIHCGATSTRQQHPVPADAPSPLRVLAVARLVEKKGLSFLIEACALLRQRGRELSCEIIGCGPLRAQLQAQIEQAGLGSVVRLLGGRSQEEVSEALSRAMLFVQPSIVASDGDMEGIPVSLMEAMAAQVPVVATRTGAISELVEDGETGVLVPPGSSAALASAIERLADDPTYAGRLSGQARRYVEAEFDLTRNVAALDLLLRSRAASIEHSDLAAGPTGDLRRHAGGL